MQAVMYGPVFGPRLPSDLAVGSGSLRNMASYVHGFADGSRSVAMNDKVEALRWASSSICKLEGAIADLDLAVDRLLFDRHFPSPEWSEAKRKIEAIIKDLEAINKG